MVLVLFITIDWWEALDGHLLGQVAYPDKVDAAWPETQLGGASLQSCLWDHLPENGIYPHRDALGRDDGDSPIATINLNTVACARIIPTLALYLTIGFTPLYLSQSSTSLPQRK